jgi:hypothetical protein
MFSLPGPLAPDEACGIEHPIRGLVIRGVSLTILSDAMHAPRRLL